MKSYFSWRSRLLLRNLDEEHAGIQADIKEAVKVVSETTQLNNVVGRELLYTATVTNTILQMLQTLAALYSSNLRLQCNISKQQVNGLLAELDTLYQRFKIEILSNPKLHINGLEKLIESYKSSRGQIRLQVNNVKYSFETLARTSTVLREEGQLEKSDLMRFKIEAMSIFMKSKELEEAWDTATGDELVFRFNRIGDHLDLLNGMYHKCIYQVLSHAKKKGIADHCISEQRIVKKNVSHELEENVKEVQEAMDKPEVSNESFREEQGNEAWVFEGMNTGSLYSRSSSVPSNQPNTSRMSNLTLTELRSKLSSLPPAPIKYRTVDEQTGQVIDSSEPFFPDKLSKKKDRSKSPRKKSMISSDMKNLMAELKVSSLISKS